MDIWKTLSALYTRLIMRRINKLPRLARAQAGQLIDTGFAFVPVGEAELILAHVTGRSREYILAHPEARVSWWQRQKFFWLLKKRSACMPLAYLTGSKEFFGLNFFVSRATLIPRSETELIVETAVEELKQCKMDSKSTILIDIGTGTGCVPISILKNLPPERAANIKTFAVDCSREALRAARRNARFHNVRINFARGNLLNNFVRGHLLNNARALIGRHQPELIIITANLPYITSHEYDSEPNLLFEPRRALVGGGNDGLKLYQELINQLARLHSRLAAAVQLKILCEINPDQVDKFKKIINVNFQNVTLKIKKDLAFRDRMIAVSIG